MFEKVNPSHPDKMADRLAGAIVDLAYTKADNPTIAVEVLAGHGHVLVIAETSLTAEQMPASEIYTHIFRIFGENVSGEVIIVPQDPHLADNQQSAPRCGDNGIFRGMPITPEQRILTCLAGSIYYLWPTDGKYTIRGYGRLAEPHFDTTVCQSCAKTDELTDFIVPLLPTPAGHLKINPLGEWTGGPDVDCGATNRKLGSDMGDAVTGGGLMGKDLSKMDVTANILCHLRAQRWGVPVECICAIGDETLTLHGRDGRTEEFPVADAISEARDYIQSLGGFESFAEWGLIRP